MDSSDVFVGIVLLMTAIVVTVFFINLKKERKKAEVQQTVHRKSSGSAKSSSNGNVSETAYVSEKTDERKRTVDGKGNVTVTDEAYYAVFNTRQGKTLRLEVSKQALKELPFNEKGQLIYKGRRFIKFKYSGGTIEN